MSPTIIPLREMERQHIQRALMVFDWNKTRAAKALGISRATLLYKIKQYKFRADIPVNGSPDWTLTNKR